MSIFLVKFVRELGCRFASFLMSGRMYIDKLFVNTHQQEPDVQDNKILFTSGQGRDQVGKIGEYFVIATLFLSSLAVPFLKLAQILKLSFVGTS